MITLELNLGYAEQLRDTIDVVLENGDLHVDEAEDLESLRNTLSYKIEKFVDYVSDPDRI